MLPAKFSILSSLQNVPFSLNIKTYDSLNNSRVFFIPVRDPILFYCEMMTTEIITIQRDSLGPTKTYMVFQFMPKYKYLEKR